jgi:hypothetical protein
MPKPLAVVVYPTWDPGGAFVSTPEATLAAGYDVRFVRADSEQALLDAVNDATKTDLADLLVIGGHGMPEMLELGAPSADLSTALDIKDGALMTALGQRVSAGGIIALDSCTTGFGQNARRNLANTLHNYAPHTRVFAPDAPTGPDSLWKLDANGAVIRPIYTMQANVYEIAPQQTPSVAAVHGALTIFGFGSPIDELLPASARNMGKDIATLIPSGAVSLDVTTVDAGTSRPTEITRERFQTSAGVVVYDQRHFLDGTPIDRTLRIGDVTYTADKAQALVTKIVVRDQQAVTYAVDRDRDGRVDHVQVEIAGSDMVYRDEDQDGRVDQIF